MQLFLCAFYMENPKPCIKPFMKRWAFIVLILLSIICLTYFYYTKTKPLQSPITNKVVKKENQQIIQAKILQAKVYNPK
jgi:hypothetical protein